MTDRGPSPHRPTPAGSASPSPRRFDEEEFGLILRRAAELQERGPEAVARHRGVTLEEMRQIAAEVGIDPVFVDRAVAQLPERWEEDRNVLVGAPYGWHLRRVVDGRVPEAELGRLLDAMRAVMKQKGEVAEVFGALEWSHDDELGPVLVRISPADGETHVEVSARRGGEAGLLYGVGVTAGTLAGGAALAEAVGLHGAGLAAAFVATGLGSWMSVRAVWHHLSARWERKLRALADRVAGAAEEAARSRPGGRSELPPEAGSEGVP